MHDVSMSMTLSRCMGFFERSVSLSLSLPPSLPLSLSLPPSLPPLPPSLWSVDKNPEISEIPVSQKKSALRGMRQKRPTIDVKKTYYVHTHAHVNGHAQCQCLNTYSTLCIHTQHTYTHTYIQKVWT